ncbi:MAG: hypothetical protein IPJ43_21575 [Saprospiraceae bacterium]|nr:hypothetical protein [Saprospiraceae bacterium]
MTNFREIESNCWDPECASKTATHKITMQVISTIPVLFNYWAQLKDCCDISRF